MKNINAEIKSRIIRWEKDTRYYQVLLQKDLFGSWCLTRIWGKRNSALGQVRHLPVSSYQEGLIKISQIEKTRKQHKYSLVT